MADVRVICAIGRRGQLGLNGQLPWEGATGPEYIADVQRFFDLTRGHVLMAGPKTAGAVPDFARKWMTVVVIRSSSPPPEEMIAKFPGRVVFIGGGPAIWSVYAPIIRHWDITKLPYDGDADRYFDPAWIVT